MYDRFTDRARKVLKYADMEAFRLRHEWIGTEHLLLGLVAEEAGVAPVVLKQFGIKLARVRREVEKICQFGPDDVKPVGALPLTPRANKAIDLAGEESRALDHDWIGTEHLLLGLLREGEGIAAQVLLNLGLRLEKVRETILELLGQTHESIGLVDDVEEPEIDEPSSEVAHLPASAREIIAEFDCQIDVVKKDKDVAVGNHEFEKAALLFDLEKKLKRLREDFLSHWPKKWQEPPSGE